MPFIHICRLAFVTPRMRVLQMVVVESYCTVFSQFVVEHIHSIYYMHVKPHALFYIHTTIQLYRASWKFKKKNILSNIKS